MNEGGAAEDSPLQNAIGSKREPFDQLGAGPYCVTRPCVGM
jgi:hypothetical protein